VKSRSPVRVIVYSLLTLGIYYLYWLANVRKELVKADQKVPSIDWLLLPLLIVIVAIVAAVIFAPDHPQVIGQDTGGARVFEAILNIVLNLMLLGFIPLYVWWYWRFAKALEHVTRGKIRAVLTTIVLWAAGPAGAGIVQDQINQLETKKA
jgi:hypothetical protein